MHVLKDYVELAFVSRGITYDAGLKRVTAERRVVRILKFARTIAVLAGDDDLTPKHLSEAVQHRTLDRNLWI